MPQARKKADETGKNDAISLLMQDHREVDGMFKEFEAAKKSDDEGAKSEIVKRVCAALTVHAEIEEEIFYPAVRGEIEDDDTMNEAEVEHGSIKDLVGQLEEMDPGDSLYDAKMTVLSEYVKHHVKEEEGEMFPKVKKAGLDLTALGSELMDRKREVEKTQDAA
jgi:hemerythrin superfamily protein